MNHDKTNRLFEAARGEQPPPPTPAIELEVMRAIHRETPVARARPASLFETFNARFPAMAAACVLLIAACVAGDYLFSPHGSPGLTLDLANFSEQWPFVEEDF